MIYNPLGIKRAGFTTSFSIRGDFGYHGIEKRKDLTSILITNNINKFKAPASGRTEEIATTAIFLEDALSDPTKISIAKGISFLYHSEPKKNDGSSINFDTDFFKSNILKNKILKLPTTLAGQSFSAPMIDNHCLSKGVEFFTKHEASGLVQPLNIKSQHPFEYQLPPLASWKACGSGWIEKCGNITISWTKGTNLNVFGRSISGCYFGRIDSSTNEYDFAMDSGGNILASIDKFGILHKYFSGEEGFFDISRGWQNRKSFDVSKFLLINNEPGLKDLAFSFEKTSGWNSNVSIKFGNNNHCYPVARFSTLQKEFGVVYSFFTKAHDCTAQIANKSPIPLDLEICNKAPFWPMMATYFCPHDETVMEFDIEGGMFSSMDCRPKGLVFDNGKEWDERGLFLIFSDAECNYCENQDSNTSKEAHWKVIRSDGTIVARVSKSGDIFNIARYVPFADAPIRILLRPGQMCPRLDDGGFVVYHQGEVGQEHDAYIAIYDHSGKIYAKMNVLGQPIDFFRTAVFDSTKSLPRLKKLDGTIIWDGEKYLPHRKKDNDISPPKNFGPFTSVYSETRYQDQLGNVWVKLPVNNLECPLWAVFEKETGLGIMFSMADGSFTWQNSNKPIPTLYSKLLQKNYMSSFQTYQDLPPAEIGACLEIQHLSTRTKSNQCWTLSYGRDDLLAKRNAEWKVIAPNGRHFMNVSQNGRISWTAPLQRSQVYKALEMFKQVELLECKDSYGRNWIKFCKNGKECSDWAVFDQSFNYIPCRQLKKDPVWLAEQAICSEITQRLDFKFLEKYDDYKIDFPFLEQINEGMSDYMCIILKELVAHYRQAILILLTCTAPELALVGHLVFLAKDVCESDLTDLFFNSERSLSLLMSNRGQSLQSFFNEESVWQKLKEIAAIWDNESLGKCSKIFSILNLFWEGSNAMRKMLFIGIFIGFIIITGVGSYSIFTKVLKWLGINFSSELTQEDSNSAVFIKEIEMRKEREASLNQQLLEEKQEKKELKQELKEKEIKHEQQLKEKEIKHEQQLKENDAKHEKEVDALKLECKKQKVKSAALKKKITAMSRAQNTVYTESFTIALTDKDTQLKIVDILNLIKTQFNPFLIQPALDN